MTKHIVITEETMSTYIIFYNIVLDYAELMRPVSQLQAPTTHSLQKFFGKI